MSQKNKVVEQAEEPILRLKQLGTTVAGRAVLRDMSFDLWPGAALSILGPNGAGKTSLLKVVAGLLRVHSGQLWRFGELVTETHSDRRVAYLGHSSFLYPALTARQNLAFYAKLWQLDRAAERIQSMIQRVGLAWAADDPVRTYSRGMIQRAAIARALLPDPQLVLLDEPSTGLDLDARNTLYMLLWDVLARGGATVLITHHVDEAIDLGDVLAFLIRGRLAWWGQCRELSGERVRTLYQQHVFGSRYA